MHFCEWILVSLKINPLTEETTTKRKHCDLLNVR